MSKLNITTVDEDAEHLFFNPVSFYPGDYCGSVPGVMNGNKIAGKKTKTLQKRKTQSGVSPLKSTESTVSGDIFDEEALAMVTPKNTPKADTFSFFGPKLTKEKFQAPDATKLAMIGIYIYIYIYTHIYMYI